MQQQVGIVAAVGHEGSIVNNVYNKGIILFSSNCPKTFIGGICGSHDNYQDIEDSYLRNAYNISEGEFDTHLSNFLDAWIPDSTLVVYCNPGACNSSRNIANRLKNECGMKKVYVLKDDWKKWKN